MKLFLIIIKLTKNFLANLALISLILEQFVFVASASAQALPIIPDGSTATQITQTASGIDQVNIAPPSANGISHNKFNDYNVNVAGQVINNFSGKNPAENFAGSGTVAVTQTQIGGLVVANPNLDSTGSAKIILNEVMSGNVSQLLGYTEIAGTKADLILSNPNGITCNGCGFINTARLLMVAGKSEFDQNGVLGFDLKEQINPNFYVPLITVSGLGLDATRVAGAEIIASSVKLLASIYGSENNSLTIKTGEGKYDYATKNIDSINSDKVNSNSPSSAPVFAIDASALAKIQAGQVYLIATKQGVGVKMEGEILASQTLNLDANGDIYYKNISAGNNVNLKAGGAIKNLNPEASIMAPNIDIQAENFNNSALISAYDLHIKNSKNFSNEGNLEALNLTISNIDNINNSGNIYSANNFNVTNVFDLTNSGNIYADGAVTISANNITNSNSGLIYGNKEISLITNFDFSNFGNVQTSADLTLSIGNNTDNFGVISGKQITLNNVSAIANSGSIVAENNINLFAKNLTNSGLIKSLGNPDFNLNGNYINKSEATIYAGENLTLNVTDSLNNSGEISTLGRSNISSNNLTNSNQILSNGALSVSASSLNNNYFSTIASLADDLNFVVNDDFINEGQISSTKNLTIFAKNLANFGDVLSGTKLITTISNQITNAGNLQSVNDFSLTTQNLDNSGLIRVYGESFINADSLNNQHNSSIFFNSNSIINSTNSFINSGTILANEKLDLTSNLTTNLGEIFSNKDLKFNLKNSFTNAGMLSSLGALDIASNSSIINNNKILSDGNLNITATSLNNADSIQSNNDITLNLTSLTNSNKIISGGNFNIKTAGNVANNGNLESANNFIIDATKLTNSPYALIFAEKDLTLQAPSIVNQNTKPSSFAITSGLVSAMGTINFLTDNLNNNAGLIASKATTLNALSASSVTLDNAVGSFVSTEEINLNVGALDYEITGTITASNIDITANNIFNRGNVTASDFIKLNATGSAGNIGSGTIINGFANGNNSNILLASGSYIDFLAKNNIENYGTIIGSTDLTLTSTNGNINNYNNGKITAGSGTATINTINGDFNNNAQESLFTANNDAIFNVKNLNNFGEISVANDLITNIENNLINNPTALIWSGRDATFNVANTFLNNQADIYADRNLTIQKNSLADSAQNKTNLVQNISGSIEAYSGDINIKAINFENKRSSMKTQGGDYVYGQLKIWGGDCHRNWRGKLKCNPIIYRDLHAANIYGIAGLEASVLSGGGINIVSNNFLNDASSIISASNFGINTANFNNNSYAFVQYNDNYRNYEYYTSFIKSGRALTITQNGATNPSLINGNNVASFVAGVGNSRQVQSTKINHIDNSQLAKTGVLAVDLSSIINAINYGNVNKISTDLNVANPQIAKNNIVAPTFNEPSNLNLKTSKIINPNKISTIEQIASISATNAVDLIPNSSNIILAGNFKINLDPSATTPLVESRSQFTDASKFYGSSYYFEKMGLNQSEVVAGIDRQNNNQSTTRILGDAFIENKLILDKLRILTNDAIFINKNSSNASQQIMELLNNSAEIFLALGLDAKEVALNGLTQEQINSLTKDIITFEATKVNGISVLAPKIYLTKETRNRLFNANPLTGSKAIANSSTLFAKENLTIDSPNAQLLNNGSIVSDLNLTLNLNSLVNKTKSLSQAQIIAGNNLSISAQNGDIKNIGAKIGAIGSLGLEALKGNILNTAIVQTNDQNLLNKNPDSYQLGFNNIGKIAGNISSTLLQDASIKSGSIAINAGKNFDNLGAEISTAKNTLADGSTTSGNLSITAGDDINIATLQLRNREETAFRNRRRFGIKVIDTSSNIGSDIESAGSLSLMTTGLANDSSNANFKSDINIIASNISSTANDSAIIINASDSVNITSALDLNNSLARGSSSAKIKSGGDLAIISNASTANISGINFKNSFIDSAGAISISSNNDISIVNDKDLAIPSFALSPSLFLASGGSIKDDAFSARSGLTFNALSDIQITSNGSINVTNNYFNTGGSIFMTASNDVNNSNYKIKASENVVISAGNNINNIQTLANNNETKIEAGNIVSLDAGNDINNIGATIKGGNLVYLTAGNEINNKALVKYTLNGSSTNSDGSAITESKALASGARYISSNLVAQGNIESNGNLVMVAENNINIKGSNVSSIGDSHLEATNGNINITTATLRDKTFAEGGRRKKRWVSISDNTNNIESNITSGGTLDLVASGANASVSALASEIGNINITGSNLTSADNLSLSAKNDIIIASAQDTDFNSLAGRRGKGKSYSNVTSSVTQIESELTTTNNGNISINSGVDNLDITGSANARGSIAIIASKLTTKDLDNDASNNVGTGSVNLIAKENLTIASALNSKYSENFSSKKGTTVKKTFKETTETATNVKSEINANGDINISSLNDINLIGTKLKADNIGIDAGAEMNIYSVSDHNKTWTSSTKSRNYSSLTGGLVGASLLTGVEPMTLAGVGVAHLGLDTNNNLKSSTNSVEKTLNIASVIEAKNDIILNSNQNLTISGSDISGKTGSLISNQGSVNIVSAIEIEKNISSNKSVERATNAPGFKGSKSSSGETSETVKNIASNLSFTESLLIKTNGNSLDPKQLADVNIKGSNLTITNGDLTIASKGNVIIENAIDNKFKEFSGKKSNETTKNLVKTVDYVETASSSNLNANNISISSLGDTVIQGSNIKTQENLLIGSFTVAQNSDGTYQKDTNGNYITNTGSSVDNLIIKDAELKEYHYVQKTKGFTGIVGVQVRALPYLLAPIEIRADLTKEALGTFLPQNYENFILDDLKIGEVFNVIDKVKNEVGNIKISQTSQERIDKTNSIASNLDVKGSMMINSVGDTSIKGSNLDISGDLLANSLGSFEVVASKNTESKTTQESYETAGEFHADLKPIKANYRAGVTKDFVEEGINSSSSSLVSSNINIGGSALINSLDKFSLISSNLISNDSIEIIAKNNLNISDAKNTQSVSSYQEKITLDVGIQVGNAYVDAGNAVIDALKAQKAIKDSYDKLEKIKDLRDQGMASSKAVERAEYQVVLSLINAGLSAAAAMQAVGNAGAAASTSLFTGVYGSIYADISKLKSSLTTESSQSIASNLIANNSINLASGNRDINITGSNVSSINGDLNLNSMLGNIIIKAGESTYSQSSKSNSRNLGGSIGTNGVSANIGFSEAQSSLDQTTFTNSQISAINGSLNINSANDTKIIGANLLASNVNMNIGGNLLLKSKQNLLESDSYNIGMSIGISGDSSGINGGSFGLNLGNGYSNKAMVEDISSIIGTNSVNINVANDTNIAGALIANQNNQGIDLGNLNLKTKSLTYSDLNNFSVSESNQLGFNLQAGYNPINPTQNGNLAIKLNMKGRESSSITKATIGKGNISIDEILNDETKIANINRDINNIEQNKRDVITSDFDSEIKIDLRLISAVANLAIGNTDKAIANWDSYANQTKKGANITYDALSIPLNSLSEAISGDVNVSDALLATGKNYQNLYQLAYNQNIVLTDLAGEGNLITYNGNQLDLNAQSRYANGFYDRNSDTLAINADSNKNDSILAGSVAHEGAHRMFNNFNQAYTISEENASHMIGDFAESRWDTYQSDNTSLRDSLPTSTLNFSNNFYANNVEFGSEVNPLIETAWDAANVALGSASLYKNLQTKNYLDAAIDGVGLAFDTASLIAPFVPGGVSTAIKGARAGEEVASSVKSVKKIESIGEGSSAIVTSGKGNKGPADFYVEPNGTTWPGTFTRYVNSSSHPISDAKNGLLPAKPDGTYVVLGKVNGANDSISMQGKLQIPYRPDYSVSGNTLDVIDSISIPKGKWGQADYLEPITKDYKIFGPGKLPQGIIQGNVPVNPNTITKLP